MAHSYRLLAVTEEKPELQALVEALLTLSEVWEVYVMEGGDAALGRFWREVVRQSSRCPYQVVLFPDEEIGTTSVGWDIVEMLSQVYRVEVASVVLTTVPTVDRAMAALRAGAWEYLSLLPFHLQALSDLLLVLAHEVEGVQSSGELDQEHGIPSQHGSQRQVAHILKARFDRAIPEISQEIDLSLRQLYRGLMAEVGMPVGGLLRNFRLQAVRVLLRETEEPIARIAKRLGCASVQSLTNVFTERVGYAPTVFRAIMRRRESYVVPPPSKQMINKLVDRGHVKIRM
ncbi:MAG: helix-turn-helix transcriptional regulator [Candidatus Latescibacteria bacterium]|nr:helix-turn-helix transcriptional regulator [Candidatus Latescibacterota bacterium]